MEINSADSAREFARAWIKEVGATPMNAARFRRAATAQRGCATICRQYRAAEAAAGHEAAAEVLDKAADWCIAEIERGGHGTKDCPLT